MVEFGTPFAFTLLIVAYFFKIIQQSIKLKRIVQ